MADKGKNSAAGQSASNGGTIVNGPVLPVAPSVPKRYTAAIHADPIVLPTDFVETARELEKNLQMPLWFFVQHPPENREQEDLRTVAPALFELFLQNMSLLPGRPIALLIHSPGGIANCAFQLANLLTERCGSFVAVVPRYAKSAATLLALGADKILLGRPPAELGPLDAQLFDPEREEHLSALDEVQALERLHAFALEAFDRQMFLLLDRTNKKLSTLFPMTMKFTADTVRPLFERVDVVRYTQMSRILKVAEEYAVRLLLNKYTRKEAEAIASHLVEKYPEHRFSIYLSEIARISTELGLTRDLATQASTEQQQIFDKMLPFLGQFTAVGPLLEV
ncbi:MAG: hypothetical protein Q7S58_03320 [Candidatus Binatus sp.]|uniref:SDH family Clp fold serine proteinase n=1 Tax=Candidatus Binatus sp. TaxID=2811406 RepID=UPI0027245F54|nr:hypothetical protein [Candidatus Binatus sp.]MDO8431420.1 hypothetical protein [Candidatus Binatus sp.]